MRSEIANVCDNPLHLGSFCGAGVSFDHLGDALRGKIDICNVFEAFVVELFGDGGVAAADVEDFEVCLGGNRQFLHSLRGHLIKVRFNFLPRNKPLKRLLALGRVICVPLVPVGPFAEHVKKIMNRFCIYK